MAWFAAAVPYIEGAAAVAGVAAQTQNQQNLAKYNAGVAKEEAKVAADQSARDEEAQRRESDAFLAKQRAAFAEAGVGSAGSTSGLLMDQSAVLAELDALNIRYAGALRGTGLLSEADASRAAGRATGRAGGLLAGAQLLSSGAKLYGRKTATAGA